MKNLEFLSPLLMSLLLASVALAQAGSPDAPDAPQPQPSVAARPEPTPAAGTGSSGEDRLISHARQYPRGPCGPMEPHRGHAYPGFPPPPGLSPVGALIGFGVGAAAGAGNANDGTVGAHVALGLIGGGLGALIGGAIGAVANPFAHARRLLRRLRGRLRVADRFPSLYRLSSRLKSCGGISSSSAGPLNHCDVFEKMRT
jgi:hypothetical protein